MSVNMSQSFFPQPVYCENLPLYVSLVGSDKEQRHVKRPEGLPFHQWLFSMEGQGNLLIDGKEIIIGKNTAFFIRKGVPHEYFAVQPPWETHWISFDGESVLSLLQTLNWERWGVFHNRESKYIDQLLSDIVQSVQSDNIYAGYRSSGLLYSFLLELRLVIRDYIPHERMHVHAQLESTIEFMEQNFARDLTLSEIANHLNVSQQYLCRIFKQTLKISPYEYLVRIRIHKAKEMLMSQNILLKEILQRTGFKDASYFGAVFKRYEGMSPSQFRQLHHS